jgi:hypothetical protein
MEHTPDPTFEAVWPSVRRGVQVQRRAPRLTSLDGKRVAFLWDYVFRGDELFPVLGKELQQRFPAIEIFDYTEFGNLHGSDEKAKVAALPGQLRARHVDAVVSGMGC